MIHLKIIITVLLVILNSGCGGSESENVNVVTTEVEGRWVNPCSAVNQSNPNTIYDVFIITFTGNNFSFDIKNYSEASCTTPHKEIPNPTASGVFTIGNSLMTTEGLQAKELDFHVSKSNGASFTADNFSIFYIAENILYFGVGNGGSVGSTPELRTSTLNFNRGYNQ